MLPVFLAACSTKSSDIGPNEPLPQIRVEVPAAARVPCPAPETLVAAGGTLRADAVTITRLGDALIDCERRRALAVGAIIQ